jgi:hypothetical protein
MDAFSESWFSMRLPHCDTCKKPAVWSEIFGPMHATSINPFGIHPRNDKTGHEVSIKEWIND